MDTVVLHIAVSDPLQAEILTASLADFPFEAFETERDGLNAYLAADRLPECRADVDAFLARSGVAGRYERIPSRDWNASWECDFPPTDVEGRLFIRAPFHRPAPEGVMEVVVRPRMSFGSGSHATTWLMARAVLELPVAGRRGLDVGCGTGVLSIVAARCGAAHVDAVDIDEWSYRNCLENAAANGVGDRIDAVLGDVGSIAGRHYDFILANINRNILLSDMPAYAAALAEGGDLLMSGFLPGDAEAVEACARRCGLRPAARAERDGWMMVRVGRG